MEKELSFKQNLFSGLLAVGFVVSLAVFAFPVPTFRFMLPSFLVFLFFAAIYNYYRFKKHPQATLWSVTLILLFYIAAGSVFLWAPNRVLQVAYLCLIGFLAFLQQRLVLNSGEGVVSSRVALTALLFFLSLSAGANYYFVLPDVVYMSVVFVFTFLLTRGTYEYTPLPNVSKHANALVVGLFATEFFWVLSFLPFHYSVLALMSFNCFFIIWQWDYAYIFKNLNLKKIIFSCLFLLSLTLFILAFTPWRVIV